MPDIFATLPPNPVQGYHYFNFSVESNPKVSLLTGGTPLNVRIDRSSRNDYEVVAVARSGPYRIKTMKEPYMHPALNRSDAEIVIVLRTFETLQASGTMPDDNGYTSEDLISLHRDDREYDNWYYSDDPVDMIGCADQMEICLVPSNTCSGLVSVTSSSISLLNLFPTLRELETFFKSFSPDTGVGFVVGSNIISHLKEFGPEVLDVRRYGLGFGDGKQNAPRSGLWENEARTWFGASIAGMQFSMVQNTAMFLLPEKRKDYKQAIKAVKGYFLCVAREHSNPFTLPNHQIPSIHHEDHSTLLLLLLLSSSVFAADDDDVTCLTKLGKESVADIHTVTVTKIDSLVPTTTTIIPTVVKKANQWSIITVFSTKTFTVTGKGDTGTFSTTTTLFKVATVTVTATTTTTSTKTGTRTSTSTTQIPTTAGFKFISDTVNSRSLNAQKGDKLFQNPHARAIIKPGMKPFKFPSKVQFTKTVASMRTTTIVKTISTTTTIIPKDVSVTKSFTTSMKVTTYSTTWKKTTKSATATKTKVICGPTEYAACQAENMFGPDVNSAGTGYYVTNVLNNGTGIPSDFQIVANGARSAEECCSSRMKFTGCEKWSFRAASRNCFLLYHGGSMCKSQSNHPKYFMSKKGADTGSGFVVGNGKCGITCSGNSDGSVFAVDL
ncbi:hypothetical protein FoTM2_009336 [Fusarium oxysporum f. sp. vasinfectum]|nr:hypothetical protein FoTM2_009336 [Fusarium oxysporum f. sp. vasinfectum]